jgi:LmbE family N-acetylglucosaminyl deacetylase
MPMKTSGQRAPGRIAAAISLTLVLLLRSVTLAAETPSGPAILQDLKSFDQMATVLMIAAHPDDENTQLITYLARGRGYRMGYLSVTRGDGGQNLLGPEFGEQLGWIRTQELLAARRLDGGRQFFTRAIDFGYSKDAAETLRIWDRQAVLGDVVRVIRTFRPDVIVTRFGTTQTPGQHGQHISSAILGVEAFKVAGDPKAYPEQLVGDVTPWQPKRIMLNGGGGGRGGGGNAPAGAVRLDAGGTDPVLNMSFGEISSRSRGMHKSQGFGGGFPGGGGRGGGGAGASPQTFTLLEGEPATNDIMDGVDTTWNRVQGGADVAKMTDEAIAKFNPENPSASVPALLAIRSKVLAVPQDIIVKEKLGQLDLIIQHCMGLTVETTVERAEVVPGEPLKMTHTAQVTSNVPVKWVAVKYPVTGKQLDVAAQLNAGQSVSKESTQTIPANTPISQPYWLREPPSTGLYSVQDPTLIGQPENPPAFAVQQVFEIGGQTIILPDEPVQPVTNPAKAVRTRRLDVIAPVALRFMSEVRIFAPGATKPIEVEVTAQRVGATGDLALEAPSGWKIEPAKQAFKLNSVGDHAKLTFSVSAPQQPASADFKAVAEINGARYSNQRIVIDYDHIPYLLLQPAATIKAVTLEMKTRGQNIGYVPGAGDSVAECIEQMGYNVTELKADDLTTDNLKKFDAVVFGVRAFNSNVRTDLAPHMNDVYKYIEDGGTVIAQYNRPETAATVRTGPYPVRISNDRITDETAKPTFLVPDHPVLNTPNKITQADFEGWVQERGIYFPNQWDEHYKPILAFSDPNEQPLNGGLLVSQYGKGYFVYTGLVWFRELPAGVPGAYRLFANLLSLGK